MIEFGLVAFAAALGLSAALVPIARRVALAANLVAAVRPDRLHREVRPYGGGLAIADTLILVVGGAWLLAGWMGAESVPGWLPPRVQEHLDARTPMLLRLAVGAIVFLVIGLIDDRYSLPSALKLLLQFFAAALVVLGLGITATVWLGAAWMGEAVSILWIVAVVNAYNMLDHADGLAAAVGIVALVALALGQMMMAEWFVPGVALVTAGALAGFLIYNFPPARLFMGDAGSYLVGYLLAVLTIVARYYFPTRGTSAYVVVVPVAVLAVPLLDAACVVVGRVACGKNPMVGDATSHLGHRMLARGAGPRTVVLVAAGLTAATGVASLMLYAADRRLLVVACCLTASTLATVLLARWRAGARTAPDTESQP